MSIKAIIEIPAGSLLKYEVDKETNLLSVDRPLNQPIPYNYGFYPGTVCEDGDALDVFVLTDTSIYPMTLVKTEIFAVIKCLDNGKSDDKILATLVGDFEGFANMGTAVISSYLESYKTGFQIVSVHGKEEALKVYEDAKKAHDDFYNAMYFAGFRHL